MDIFPLLALLTLGGVFGETHNEMSQSKLKKKTALLVCWVELAPPRCECVRLDRKLGAGQEKQGRRARSTASAPLNK